MAKTKNGVAMVEDDWRTEDDLRVLINAAAIRKDPKRMAKVQELAKRKLVEVAAVVGDTDKD